MQVYPHGSTDSLPYATMGSGSLNAMAMFEASYQDDLTKDAAISLVARAIRSGIYNDLGSGSNVDICVITKDGVEYKRNYEYLMGKTYKRIKPVHYGRGSTSAFPFGVFIVKHGRHSSAFREAYAGIRAEA